MAPGARPCLGRPRLLEVHEPPGKPAEVAERRAEAATQARELQEIFSSKDDSLCTALRARLAKLADAETSLRARVAVLEREYKETLAEQAIIDDPGHRSDAQGTPDTSVLQGGAVSSTASTNATECEKPDSNWQRGSEVFAGAMETINKRRGESRYREAAALMKAAIARLKEDIKDVDRRSERQRRWMKRVADQILQLGVTKAAYELRLEHAEQRARSLGDDLKQAYANTYRMLEHRMDTEDGHIRNAAMSDYLTYLRKADANNEVNFHENKAQLGLALEQHQMAHATAARLSELKKLTYKHAEACSSIQACCKSIIHTSGDLHVMWVGIPTVMKDRMISVGLGRPGAQGMHPAKAIEQMRVLSAELIDKVQHYLSTLEDARA